MEETKKVNHQNIFESFLAQDIFVLDILEKIANDWKTSCKANSYNREKFEDFVTDDFMQWIELELEEFCDDEFGEGEQE